MATGDAKGTIWENLSLDVLYGASAFTAPGSIYVGLHTGDPGEAGAANEVSGNGYARGTIPNTGAYWPAASNGAKAFAGTTTFGTASASWGTLSYWSTWGAAAAGTMFHYGTLTTPTAITTGMAPYIGPNGITINEA